MCGISVCFALSGTKPNSCNHGTDQKKQNAKLTIQLDSSVESMRHRGPNAKGIWISTDNSVGLGHVRLSTRDLSSAGHQPLHSSDEADDIHLVVNGELYYDPSLRTSLEKEYNFQSGSDSEMAIALYRRYGASFVEHIRGEFSLALYDARTQTLVVARDRFGIKPLHYGIFGDKLLIATQCKGVLQLLDDKKALRWDVRCVAEGAGHCGARTLFQDIKKFPPGHVLVVRQSRSEELNFRPFFKIRYPANSGADDDRPTDELINELRARLLEAVRLRLYSSDVPVGILLSGGVDSSAVAGMAATLSRERLAENNGEAPPPPTCFTIGFPDDDDLDESAVARRTAEHLDLPIEKIIVTEEMLANEFEEACWLGEALMYDLHHIAKKALSRHISTRGLKVVLNGDGSDELFGGYSFFVADRLLEDDQRRSPSLQNANSTQREQARQENNKIDRWYGQGMDDRGPKHKAAEVLGLPPAFCNMAVPRLDNWLVDEVSKKHSPFQALHESFSPDEIEEMANYHPMHRAMLAWNKTFLPNMIIAAISDGAEMAHGVESRPPFLDHVVFEFVSTLSVDMLVHLEKDGSLVEKWIFREAVKPYVTEEIYTKRKHAFAAPFKYDLGGPLHAKLSSLITRENIDRLGFVDWKRCENMVDRSFVEKDQLLFREVIWLAQIISIGLQFEVQPFELAKSGYMESEDHLQAQLSESITNGHNGGSTNGYANRHVSLKRKENIVDASVDGRTDDHVNGHKKTKLNGAAS